MLVELWDRIHKEVLELSFCLQYYYTKLDVESDSLAFFIIYSSYLFGGVFLPKFWIKD